jgi:hypothetical protein
MRRLADAISRRVCRAAAVVVFAAAGALMWLQNKWHDCTRPLD